MLDPTARYKVMPFRHFFYVWDLWQNRQVAQCRTEEAADAVVRLFSI